MMKKGDGEEEVADGERSRGFEGEPWKGMRDEERLDGTFGLESLRLASI